MSGDIPPHLGASKRILLKREVDFDTKRKNDKWGSFDEDWSFAIHEIPEEFRNQLKYENFILAKQEERDQKIILESKPFHIEIEPTNLCNLRCPLCSTGVEAKTRKKTMLSLENFKKLINRIKDTTLLLALQNWGEPTLVPDLPKMIKYAAEAKIWTHISTNFSIKYSDEYLNSFIQSGLGRLKIDLDGVTQEVYEKYRVNGNLQTVIENTKKAVAIKNKNNLKYPIIQARMIVTKKNEHQKDDFVKLSESLGVDEIEMGNIQLNPNTAANEWLPSDENYVYKTYLGERRYVPCHWPWSGMVVNSDGGVTPCTIVDDPNTDFGNVFHNDIMEIWNNEYYQSARTTWTKGAKRTKTTICNICKNDTHNPNLLRVGNTFSLTLDASKLISKPSSVKSP